MLCSHVSYSLRLCGVVTRRHSMGRSDWHQRPSLDRLPGCAWKAGPPGRRNALMLPPCRLSSVLACWVIHCWPFRAVDYSPAFLPGPHIPAASATALRAVSLEVLFTLIAERYEQRSLGLTSARCSWKCPDPGQSSGWNGPRLSVGERVLRVPSEPVQRVSMCSELHTVWSMGLGDCVGPQTLSISATHSGPCVAVSRSVGSPRQWPRRPTGRSGHRGCPAAPRQPGRTCNRTWPSSCP